VHTLQHRLYRRIIIADRKQSVHCLYSSTVAYTDVQTRVNRIYKKSFTYREAVNLEVRSIPTAVLRGPNAVHGPRCSDHIKCSPQNTRNSRATKCIFFHSYTLPFTFSTLFLFWCISSLYTVSQKTVQNCFCHNFVKFENFHQL